MGRLGAFRDCAHRAANRLRLEDLLRRHPEIEEIELHAPDFSSDELERIATVPRWRDHDLAQDQTPHYRSLRRALEALSFLRGPRRWVLKWPQHLEPLGPLLSVFPDATLVFTHRDPLAVIASAATMLA